MTHAKEPFGACTEPSDAIVNLLERILDMKCSILGGKYSVPRSIALRVVEWL